MKIRRFGWVCALALGACCTAPSGAVAAGAAEKIIHSFRGGRDGSLPYYGGLISDGSGNSYGTTVGGGGHCSDGGCGTVFKLSHDRKLKILYAFKGGVDGEGPSGALMLDASGSLYGTTATGGGCTVVQFGWGTVFKVAPGGKEDVLYAFQGSNDGYYPFGNIVMGKESELYGTTASGGAYSSACPEGCGTVFEIQPNGTKNTLYQFQGGEDGSGPSGALIADASGNLYGTTNAGGGCSGQQYGCGTVFMITPEGQESLLYSFQGGTDGYSPRGGVIMDESGNLYGTTIFGGAFNYYGVVFEVPAGGGSESVLYSFQGGNDGSLPMAGVVSDDEGNFYGTTWAGGGGQRCKKAGAAGCGTVYKLTSDGTETILYSFSRKYGELPLAPVLLGKNGAIYGTTSNGGTHKRGVVFKLKQ